MSHIHAEPFDGVGKTFRIATADASLSDKTIKVEDYYDRLFGEFWLTPVTHAGKDYAIRRNALGLPMDEEIVYGRDKFGFGLMVHVKELGEVVS